MSAVIDLIKAEHVGVRELRDHLCEFMKDKKPAIVVTERGQPVRVIVPYAKMVELLEFFDEVSDSDTMRNIHEGAEAIKKGSQGVSFSGTYKKYRSAGQAVKE
ncbi:MAG: type II toxin-antitoxin system Phd/YefM family antitoxin [Candidatus Omnitrophica bacterium]|nr:type II toxin-antitoxin system Phd/YefM family antitoxin [Candidatus Omnitrophota bacterium]MBU4468552.1 type II toxin-antitoxin system Phd/YefM family antitoxin [Candidatus Omnitrophota bacterium]MCG2707768.1 type II toxin-antitoxin system Phd/YefM family antitoxin [Candidatus Omnitrophota bacterium]